MGRSLFRIMSIVQQEHIPGPGHAATDLGDGGDGLDAALFPGHHAKRAVQPAAPLRKTLLMTMPS